MLLGEWERAHSTYGFFWFSNALGSVVSSGLSFLCRLHHDIRAAPFPLLQKIERAKDKKQ